MRARRGAARIGLQPDVGLDVSLAVRAAPAPRSAGHRPVARLRDLRLVRSAHGRQTGAQGAAHRRQLRAAARGAVAHQPRQEPDGRPDALAASAGWNRRDEQIAKIYTLLRERAEREHGARLRRPAAENRGAVGAVAERSGRNTPSSSASSWSTNTRTPTGPSTC